MEPISATPVLSTPGTAGTPNAFGDLGSEDFLKLLIMELRHQDPLEPVGNAELLQQISSVRDIELSTTLTDSLRLLTGQQRFASASSLIGQFVTALPDDNGVAESGLVVGIRFAEDGQPILRLANGSELPVEKIGMIESPLRAAEALVGQAVVGVDGRDPSKPEMVEGVVTGARIDEQSDVMLELDTGHDLRLRDLAGVVSAETA